MCNTDRLIIFSLTTTPNDCKEATDCALQVANKAITTHADIVHPPLILANITATNNLVFTVAPQHLSTTYEPYLGILEDALHEFPIGSSRVSQRWTCFIVRGVPTTATPESALTKIETSYPSLRMGQTPHWLTSPERHQGKEASSMIVTFVGEMTKKSLGATSLTMFNRECTIAKYITFGPATQCNRCQTYGHLTQCCTASNHTCTVCAQPYPTKDESPMCNRELQSRTLLQPPTDPLCQLPTTTQSLRPKLPHLHQDHVGNAPRQRSNHGHDNGRLEGTEEGNGTALSSLPKFLPTASLLYNIPAKMCYILAG